MKCLREMNDRKDYLKIKIKNLNAYFHVAPTNYNTSLLGGKCIAEKILVYIYLPGWLNLGGVVYAKESGGIGFKSTAIL